MYKSMGHNFNFKNNNPLLKPCRLDIFLEPLAMTTKNTLYNSSLTYGIGMNDSAVNRDINASTTTQCRKQSCRN